MAKKKKNKKKSTNKGGEIFGSLLRPFVLFIGFILKILVKLFSFFGLWIPLIYAVFGGFLYLCWGFNPFVFDTYGTLYLCGALACVVAAAIISVRNVIVMPARSIYKGYKNPPWKKSSDESDEKDEEYKRQAGKLETVRRYKLEKKLMPPEIEDFRLKKEDDILGDYLLPIDDFNCRTDDERNKKKYSLDFDWLPQIGDMETETVSVRSFPKEEKPQIYFSGMEPDLLVHEYTDRFELFRASGRELIPIGVKYKEGIE